jgi:hypothetical protein
MLKRLGKPLVMVLICVLGWLGPGRYRAWKACKQRGAAFAQRADLLKRDADHRLRIGTKKSEVAQFFAEHGIPVEFLEMGNTFVATGQIYSTGCAPAFACGSDRVLLGLRVEVDALGTVTSKPQVVPMYTDCL